MSADSIQSAVNSHAAGTLFCFLSGTYVLNHYVTLKDSNQFICVTRRTCVLTGLDQYRGAFTAAYGTGHQIIRGFVAEHFIAVAGSWPNAALQLRDNGLIDDNEVRYNRVGINASSNQTISNNFIHHNGQYGIAGGPLSNLIIENNDLSSNNTLQLDPNNDASGSKIVGGQPGSYFVTWRNNHVHDNYGQGIWSDGNVHNVLYEGNLVENNWGEGIDHEISWDATIRGNLLRNNMRFEVNLGKSCWWGSQIGILNSQNVTITGNTVEGINSNAICLTNATRPQQAPFPTALANVSVANNVVKLSGVVNIGWVGNSPAQGISFSANTYYVDVLSNRYWNDNRQTPLTWQEWQAAGKDTTGTLLSLTGSVPTGGSSSGGALAGSGVAGFAGANLTTSGISDWAKWPSYIRKATGGSQISNFTKIGAPSVLTYNNDRRPISWTDGTPSTTGTNDTNGVYIAGVGNGFQISAPADTKPRTLLVYVGGWVSGGRLVAHLSDGSAPDFVNTSISSTTGQYDAVYTLTYHAASAGQRLVVQWIQASGTGNVTLQAAALQ
jgi:parallel beta-helix repeat protein